MYALRLIHRTVLAVFAVFAATAMLASAHAQATPEAVTQQWIAAFNAGDMAKAATFNSSAGLSIIDEDAPFYWSGPKAFDQWGADFDARAKSLGITEPHVSFGGFLVRTLTPTAAYLVYPSVYTYKQKGVAMTESARMALTLRKEGANWKVTAWCWTGTVPKPAK